VTYDHPQLQLRKRFLIPERILDDPSFARQDTDHVQNQHKLPSQERNVNISRQIVRKYWHTSVENQNLWGNRRNILVYVAITMPWIASCLNSDDSSSDARNKKRGKDTYEAKEGEIGHHHSEAPQG